MDLWEQLLQEIRGAGPAVRGLHVPSHVGIHSNTKADTPADMGRRQSPLLKRLVTAVLKLQKTIKKKTKRRSGGDDEQGQNTISKFK